MWNIMIILYLLVFIGIAYFYFLDKMFDKHNSDCDPEYHQEATKRYHSEVYKGDFKTFKKEFMKRSWGRSHKFPDSLFSTDGKSSFHAHIIEFDDKCMLLDEEDFKKAYKFKQEILERLPLKGPEIEEWSDSDEQISEDGV